MALLDDLKSIVVGGAAVAAHAVTNSADFVGKAGVVGLSTIPVFGSFVTAAYVFKQSYHNTGKLGESVAKAVVAGAVAFVPGAGPAITGAYALKNIGEQIEKEGRLSGKGTIDAIKNKYSDAYKVLKKPGKMEQLKKNVSELYSKATSVLTQENKLQRLGENVKKLFAKDGVTNAFKAARDAMVSPEVRAQQQAEKDRAQGIIPTARILHKSEHRENAPMARPLSQEELGNLKPVSTPVKPITRGRSASDATHNR